MKRIVGRDGLERLWFEPDELEACTRTIETVLVEAAFDPNASTRVGAVAAGR